MYDGINPDTVPNGADIYAGYVGGKWPSLAGLKQKFPNKLFLSIAVNAQEDAQVLDVERYDATPEEAPGWANRQRIKGNPFPVCYVNQDNNWDAVKAAFIAQHAPQPLYWVAKYVSNPTHIPVIPAGAIALQYYSYSGYDVSTVAEYWPGVDPVPVNKILTMEDEDMSVTSQSGRAGLNWAKGTRHVIQLTWDAQAVASPTFLVKGCADTATVTLAAKLSGAHGKAVLELGANAPNLSGVIVYGPTATAYELCAV